MDEEKALLVSKNYGSTASLTPASTKRCFEESEQAGSVTSAESNESIIVAGFHVPSLRTIAIQLSLYVNILITLAKLITYIQTFSLSVLAALLDSVLDVVSQMVLFHTEKHSSLQRSSAFYPAGASRLEPIGVLTCAALMGVASFEVLKDSLMALIFNKTAMDADDLTLSSFWNMLSIVLIKVALLYLCKRAANRRMLRSNSSMENDTESKTRTEIADSTMEALAKDHLNDALSNVVAALALLCALKQPSLWWLDPVGAVVISLYIIYSWYTTGKEQIEHLTGKVAPEEFIEDIVNMANAFDDRLEVDHVRAYHFGPKFLVELEVVMPKETLLFESHDVGMELQYEIEGREEVERCFVHIDYQTRPYDEHVVSKVPELREKYRPRKLRSTQSV
jgi:cation diffusion facilitator family transporter